MRIAILGTGAREHAIARAFLYSGFETLVIPGNDGMKKSGIAIKNVDETLDSLFNATMSFQPDIVVVGPTEYMVLGVVDKLKDEGIKVIGAPSKSAMLEADKVFAKEFMVRHNIPTPRFRIVHTLSQLERALKEFDPPYVIKIPTLQGGKGSFILPTISEALDIGSRVITSGFEGMWSDGLVVEQFVPGEEYAVQVLISSGDYVILPMVWEYQRLYDGGRGPNTGGMGAVAPIRIDDKLFELIKDLVGRTVKAMLKESLAYEGFLYLGVMASPDGVRVLEYNVRLGDPETEAIVPLDSDGFVRMIKDTAFGRLPEKIQPSGVSVAIALVSEGAPYHYTESVIGLPNNTDGIYFDHVREKEGRLIVSGWRPCVVVGSGDTYEEAINRAYKKAKEVVFEGKFYRGDIGKTLL